MPTEPSEVEGAQPLERLSYTESHSVFGCKRSAASKNIENILVPNFNPPKGDMKNFWLSSNVSGLKL